MNIKQQLIKVNHTKGRRRPIDMIVIHVMEGDLPADIDSPYSWFNNPMAKVSAHYGIDRDDHPIRQWVEEKDTAWANGRVLRPTAALVKERLGVNPNDYSISIENEGTGRVPPTGTQLTNNALLVRDIANRYGFPISRRHIVGHDEIYAGKPNCPGKISVDAIVALAKGLNGPLMFKKKVFKVGDKGDDVKLLQLMLVEAGYMTQDEMYTGPGIFGPRTNRAFTEFLKAHGG